MKYAGYVSWIILCKLCEFDEKITTIPIFPRQCRINYGSGGSPEPEPLNSGGLIISLK